MYGNIMVIDELYLEEANDTFKNRLLALKKIIDYSNSLKVQNIGFINEAICKEKELYGNYMNGYLSLGFRPILEKESKHFVLIKLNDYL